MSCSLKRLGRKIRFTLFPMSKVIEERTKKVDQELEELRCAKKATFDEMNKVTQPDILRSLVISMNKAAGKRK